MGEGGEEPGFIRLEVEELPEGEMLSHSHAVYEQMDKSRTTRLFSDR